MMCCDTTKQSIYIYTYIYIYILHLFILEEVSGYSTKMQMIVKLYS